MVSRKFGVSQTKPKSFFNQKSDLCLCIIDYSEDYYLRRITRHASDRPKMTPFAFQLSFYLTPEFDTWWKTYHAKEFMNVATLSKHLNDTYSSLQQKFKKGRDRHIKKIQAFYKYFEIVYDLDNLSRKIHETTVTLKEKMFAKLPNLHIPDYLKDTYSFALKFNPSKFPNFPTSEMALAFTPLFPQWFICGEFLKVHKNKCLKPAQRVTLTKHDIYNFKGHLHVDIKHARVETLIHEGEGNKRSCLHLFTS